MKNKILKLFSLLVCSVLIGLSFTGCVATSEEETPDLTPEELAIQNDAFIKPSQDENYKYKIYDSYVSISQYIGDASAVEIPEIFEDKPIYVIEDNAFEENENITSVTMKNNIVQIGNYAFQGCKNLSTLILPETLKTIPDGMCTACESLSEIKFPDTLVSIGQSAFSSCVSLREIIIPGRTELIASYAFSGCENIESVMLLDTISQTKDGELFIEFTKSIQNGAFSSLINCKQIIVGESVIEVIGGAFNNCGKELGEETMFYGFVPSPICDYCATNKLKFTEIKEGDEIDTSIKKVMNKEIDGIVEYTAKFLTTTKTVNGTNFRIDTYKPSLADMEQPASGTFDGNKFTVFSEKEIEAKSGYTTLDENTYPDFLNAYAPASMLENEKNLPKFNFEEEIVFAVNSENFALDKSIVFELRQKDKQLNIIFKQPNSAEAGKENTKSVYCLFSIKRSALEEQKIDTVNFIFDAVS